MSPIYVAIFRCLPPVSPRLNFARKFAPWFTPWASGRRYAFYLKKIKYLTYIKLMPANIPVVLRPMFRHDRLFFSSFLWGSQHQNARRSPLRLHQQAKLNTTEGFMTPTIPLLKFPRQIRHETRSREAAVTLVAFHFPLSAVFLTSGSSTYAFRTDPQLLFPPTAN